MSRYTTLLFLAVLLLTTCVARAANPFSGEATFKLSESSSKDSDKKNAKVAVKSDALADRPCTLAVMADLHARPESLPMLKKAFARVNQLDDVYGVAIVGDLVSKLGTHAEYDVLAQGLKELSVPIYAVPGNHDILYKDYLINGEKKRGTPAEKKAKHQLFKKTLGLKSLYYAKKAGGHLLVFLPNDALSAIPCSMPSDEAWEFLRKTLKDNRELPTIIFSHAPLAGSYADKKTMPPLQANAQPSARIRRLLKENPQVYLWFSGHLHITPAQRYFNCPANKAGNVNVIHVPPSQIHSSWIQVVRLSPKGATVRTMEVKSGKYLKKHTRTFKPGISNKNDEKKDKNKNHNSDDELKIARIVVSNAHSGGNHQKEAYGEWLADLEPDLSLISEAVSMAPHLRPAGRVFNAGMDSRGSREVAVVLRDGLPLLGRDSGKVSPDLGIGIAHDRWWSCIKTRVAGIRTRVYSLHLNAVIQEPGGEPRQVNRWEVTREGLSRLEDQWKKDIKEGWAVIVGGDLNWNDSRPKAQSHRMSPGQLFKRLGMKYVNRELMWLAWTPETHKLAKNDYMAPTKIPGLVPREHPALLIDLKARHKPAKELEEDRPDPEEEELDTTEEEADEPETEETVDESELEAENVSEESDATSSEGKDTGIDAKDDSDNSPEEQEMSTEEQASYQAAIERIRELVATIYEHLKSIALTFTRVLMP